MSLADSIIQQSISGVKRYLNQTELLNQLDEYGFTPLIESAIVNNIQIATMLLEHGASANVKDVTGGTPLQWAVENRNLIFCQLLLSHGANPNAYNLAGQPVLAMPMLRQQHDVKELLVKSGADISFAQDYINTKLLGHIYELVGMASIIDPYRKRVEVDFEGFYLEVTLNLITDALRQFQNHYAARQMRRYYGLAQRMITIFETASRLVQLQQYQVNRNQFQREIAQLLQTQPLIIPVGYEGHAITFIRYHDLWIKCDRREDSRLYDNIMIYRMTNPQMADTSLCQHLLYKKQSSDFINHELDRLLGLQPITEIKVEAQISGNCSWANVEACIPVLLFLFLMEQDQSKHTIDYYKTQALNYFHRWREWNRERMLTYCIDAYRSGDLLQKASKAEILAAILFQRCDYKTTLGKTRFEKIMNELSGSPYEYLIQNYTKRYYYEGYTEEGERFYNALKRYAISKKAE